jgi:polyhydroxyalkanoate synthesis repressor PhaR
MNEPRIIKKYPNRRLYDTVESRYITLADIRRLVIDKTEFVVIDKKSQEDITRTILLQVISEQEQGEPLMSQDFLAQIIRSYGGAMQNFVGSYLDQSLKFFTNQQQQVRERMRESPSNDPFALMTNLTQRNLENWRAMQDQFLKAFTGNPQPVHAKEEEPREEEEEHPDDEKKE